MRNVQVCFSGGRTSAYMAKLLKERKAGEYNMIFTMANTGLEDEDTLRFADAVDREFGLNLVWLEAVVHPGKKSCTHKVVTYETASRRGEPYEAVVAKYGLANHTFKHCTRELKANVMQSYARSVWGRRNFDIAIGIRADEKRRVAKNATKNRILYPLVNVWPTTKGDVLEFFEQFDWDLRIPEHLGNCQTCFKKSDKKLNAVYRSIPGAFDFFLRIEPQYCDVGPNNIPGPRRIFRNYRSTRNLLNQFDFLDCDSSRMFNDEDSGTCSESCEVYETEALPEAA